MSEQPKCTLRDAELLADVEKWVSKLCDTGGRAWTLSVPVNFNRDPDMLITELCKRYAALLARHNALREEFEDVKDHNQYLEACLEDRNAEMMRHVRMYEDLCDAVAWEREFDEVLVWLVRTGRYPRDMASRYDLANERECARAEVDRLMGEK